MACGAVPTAPIPMFSAVPSGSTMIPLQLLGFCHADFAILDRRLPARKCLAPADSAQIPFPRRAGSRPIHYLEYEEIQAVLASVDRTTVDGRRDYVLLATMFNTGARVQEIVTLRIRDLQLEALPQVRLYGK